ncbi:MAG: hypothetical protein FVQ81_00880 [Candidatus Glassbacteria bacterium]|nr:hypothetical protein [Candidatus Glassbacteria bacterium]
MARLESNFFPACFFYLLLSAFIYPSILKAGKIFADDFESGELAGKWNQVNIRTPAHGGYETNPEHVFSGRRSLRLTAVANDGQSSVAQVQCWFMPGYDRLYYRWYAKFAPEFDEGNHMHWTMIGGSRTDDKYSGFGKAGIMPNGTDFFTTMLDPWRNWKKYPPPGALCFASSWPEMKPGRDSVHYSNHLLPEVPFVPERGRWYCYEVMVGLNDPGQKNGEQAFWIDGKKLLHVKNLRWRDSDVLRLNFFWFAVYIHQAQQDNTCWYDDLVISTVYLGPKAEAENSGGN